MRFRGRKWRKGERVTLVRCLMGALELRTVEAFFFADKAYGILWARNLSFQQLELYVTSRRCWLAVPTPEYDAWLAVQAAREAARLAEIPF